MTFEEVWEKVKPITGYLFEEEARVLFNLAIQLPEHSTMIELGCYCGRSSVIFAEVARAKGSKLICVDVFKSNFDATPLKGSVALKQFTDNILVPYYDYVELIKAKTTAASSHVVDSSVDFIFIDADHSYKGVKADCAHWLPKLKSGGIVAFHDFHGGNFPGVSQAALEFVGLWHNVCNDFSVAGYKKP